MRVLLATVLLVVTASAQAAATAGIALNPISVSLDAKRPADAVTLSNGTAENKVIQVEIMNWTHENGEDRFRPATDMIVSPPMFRVAAGAKQVVRVGTKSRGLATSPTEKTYRMFFQEVPETAPSSAAAGGGAALRLLLRFGVPVFIKPAKPLPDSMSWRALRHHDGTIALSVSNTGNRHVKLSEVKLESAARVLNADGFAYVFAGETYAWILKPGAAVSAGEATVSASTDDGPVHASLALQGP